YGGINAYKFALGIHERSTTVSGVDGRICLDKILDGIDVFLIPQQIDATPFGTDDTCSNGAGQVHRVTDCYNPLAYPGLVTVAKRQEIQAFLIDFQQGQVGGFISTYQFGD